MHPSTFNKDFRLTLAQFIEFMQDRRADRVAGLRAHLGLTQVELATTLNVSRRSVQYWESPNSGQVIPSDKYLKMLSLCLRHAGN